MFNQSGPGGPQKQVVLTEKKPGPGASQAWRAYVAHFSYGHGVWDTDLSYADDTGSTVSSITYVFKDMNGDGVDEVVFGFRLLGSGSGLTYDLVDGLFGHVKVAVERQLSHGQANVQNTGITDWDAYFGPSDPNCCPSYFNQSTVVWSSSSSGWVVIAGPHVPSAGSGSF